MRERTESVSLGVMLSPISHHDQDLALRAELPGNAGVSLHFPHLGSMMNGLDGEIEKVARHDGVPESGLVDTEKKYGLRRVVDRIGKPGEDSADLRQRLENEYARHDGAPGE